MNKIMLVGRLTKDPETRYSQTAEAMAVCRFTIAASRRYKRDGEPEADFINCIAFAKTAEFIQRYFTKGMAIGLSGRLQVSNYEDKAGNRKTYTNVVVEEAEFVEKKQSCQNNDTFTQPPQRVNDNNDGFELTEIPVYDDDLPF